MVDKSVSDMNTEEKINWIYNDKMGFQSLKNLWTDVHKRFPEISYNDVRDWYIKHTNQQIVIRGQNSFVGNKPYDEFEVDLFFVNDKEDDEYKIAIAGVDVFSKFGCCFALSNKTPDQFVEALKRMFEKMGGKPKIIFGDEEGSLQSKLVNKFLKDENVKYIINRNHARFVERFIRTIKMMIYKRQEKRPDERWYDLLFEILLTYNYKMIHSSIGMRPADAVKEENWRKAKENMLKKAKFQRTYNDIKVGDKVRIFKKRANFQKENVQRWSKNNYTVERIENEPIAGDLYYLGTSDKPYLRSQIFKPKRT